MLLYEEHLGLALAASSARRRRGRAGQGEALFDLIASRQSRAMMTVINHAGHFCFREQARQFEAAISGFIECAGGW